MLLRRGRFFLVRDRFMLVLDGQLVTWSVFLLGFLFMFCPGWVLIYALWFVASGHDECLLNLGAPD
jgi:hypothetical protein